MSKDKKKITAAIAGIYAALVKAYALLSEDGGAPELEKEALPALTPAIVKTLTLQLSEIDENARFEGLSHEEIVEKKEQERTDALQRLQEKSAEDFQALLASRQPVKEEPVTEEDPEADDPGVDTPEGDADQEGADDPKTDEPGGNDQNPT